MGRTLIGGTAVATVSSSSTTTASQSWQEQQTEGYPIFGLWGSDGGNQYQSMQMYDSLLNTRGTPHGAKANSTTTYQFGNYAEGALGHNGDHSTTYATTGQLTSQPVTSNYWVQANRCNNVFPMHEMIDLSATGSYRSLYGTSNTSSNSPTYNTIYLMNMVLPEGRRPRKFFRCVGETIDEVISLRRIDTKYMSRRFNWVDWLQNNHASIHAAMTAATNNFFGYGNISYNERTNKMAISSQRVSTNSMSAILIAGQSGKLLTDPSVNVSDWFEAATPVSWTDWNAAFNSTTGSETRYDHKLMLGDNDKLAVFHHQTGSSMYMCLIDWNEGSAGSHTYNNNYHNVSADGFSANNGTYYATRFQSTWDQNWHMAFAGTYQEGGGMAGIIVSTKDPSRVFGYRDPYNFGGGVNAIGKSSFFFHRGDNTDSTSKNGGMIRLGDTSQEGTDATTYGASSSANIINIANKGSLTPVGGLQCGINNMWYTTDYPTVITCTWWPKDDPVHGSPAWLNF